MKHGFLEPSDVTTLRALNAAGDYLAIVKLTSGSHASDLWAAAMNAHYGRTGLHDSYRGEDGRPTAKCLETFPRVAEEMNLAREQVARLIEWYAKEPEREAEMARLCEILHGLKAS